MLAALSLRCHISLFRILRFEKKKTAWFFPLNFIVTLVKILKQKHFKACQILGFRTKKNSKKYATLKHRQIFRSKKAMRYCNKLCTRNLLNNQTSSYQILYQVMSFNLESKRNSVHFKNPIYFGFKKKEMIEITQKMK